MKKENVFWGLVFVVIAASILMSALGLFQSISWLSIAIAVFLVVVAIKGIRYLCYPQIFFPLAILYLMFQQYFIIPQVNVWPLLGVAFFLSLGLSLIFPKKKLFHWHHKNAYSESETTDYGNSVNQSVTFNSSIKYINSTTFENGTFECSFGSLKVYFDNAILKENSANIQAETSFGSITFYIPRGWNVHINVETAFGSVEEKGQKLYQEGAPVLYLNGEVSFGSIEIIYI